VAISHVNTDLNTSVSQISIDLGTDDGNGGNAEFRFFFNSTVTGTIPPENIEENYLTFYHAV
jgi:hypothetical protein